MRNRLYCMPDVPALDEKCGVAPEQQLVDEEPILPQTNLMGEQVAMRGALISWLSISWWCAEGVTGNTGVVKVNPPVVKWAEQADGNLQPANLPSLSAGNLADGE